ncbi:MAG: prolyl aminopeptidase [Planctomycetes bacterium]|nr:prolyl aminopeptidase [Planctomycetota bacterium]
MSQAHWFPAIEPHASGFLKVGAPHEIWFEECGNPNGEPFVFLHGGPGAGCSEKDRRFFDPSAFRIVLFDQRGCGRSRPAGELENNTTDAIIADIESLREERGIETWHVFGGSWGSTLALAYAQAHPERVRSLVLRGIWLLRQEELVWWLYGMRWVQPELWEQFAHHIPENERDDLLSAYWKRLTGDDRAVALAAARSWSIYEGSCCTLLPNEEFSGAFAEDDLAWNLARLEAHWFRNVRFDPDDRLLRDIDKIRHLPAFAVHGRYDVVCPVRNLHDLRTAWPELSWRIVGDAGHSSHEPGITEQLVAATNRIARTGSPALEQ